MSLDDDQFNDLLELLAYRKTLQIELDRLTDDFLCERFDVSKFELLRLESEGLTIEQEIIH